MNRTGRAHEVEPTPTDISVALRVHAEIGDSAVGAS